jgi:hypothetical protein
MPNLNTRRFSQPETLKKLRRESLLQWLAPARDYLFSKGISLPDPATDVPINFEFLEAIFSDPQPDMPEYLVESLEIINDMADPQGMDAILAETATRPQPLRVPDDSTPADVALQAWLEDPELLALVHVRHNLTRPRSFVTFGCAADTIPAFAAPTYEQIKALEAHLDDFYAAKKRGRGCRVQAFADENQCRFLVRHGDLCKREGAIKDGESVSVFYRPEKYDVVIYDSTRGEIRIHCSGKRELNELRRAFGRHLFGDDGFFPGTGKFTLAPLRKGRECLACGDIDGIESITLVGLEIVDDSKSPFVCKYSADDMYAVAEDGNFAWPTAERIKRATFAVKFVGRKSRRVTIVVPNRALYGRDEDSVLIEQWLKARSFLIEEVLNESEEGPLAGA